MSLTNAQHDALMRMYENRRLEAHRDLQRRREEAYARIPGMQALDDEVYALRRNYLASVLAEPEQASGQTPQEQAGSSAAGKAPAGQAQRRSGSSAAENAPAGQSAAKTPDSQAADRLRASMDSIAERREALLVQYGYPADYLMPRWRCPDCQDTGYIGRQMCRCMRQAVIDLFYAQSGLQKLPSSQTLDAFSLDYYPDDAPVPAIGRTPRDQMALVLSASRNFVSRFDEKPGSLLFYGGTGLGKTFLARGIAGELLSTAHSVLFFSAEDLFRQLANAVFSRTDPYDPQGDTAAGLDPALTAQCDLLIIDDLGSEMPNSFVQSQLLRILNERADSGRSTIITTNLSLPQIDSLYTGRISSRISSGFTLLAFYGDDIRIQKKLRRID